MGSMLLRLLAMQSFGDPDDKDGKEDFKVDTERALGAPFVLPSGGNPLNPQGRYLPVYPCYDRHIRDFCESAEGVKKFLAGRLERTIAFSLSEGMVDKIASAVHETLKSQNFADEKKVLGILILARCEPEGYYTFQSGRIQQRIGQTTDGGSSIVPNFPKILEGFWVAKLEEGREAGAAHWDVQLLGEGGRSRLGILQGVALGIPDLDLSPAARWRRADARRERRLGAGNLSGAHARGMRVQPADEAHRSTGHCSRTFLPGR